MRISFDTYTVDSGRRRLSAGGREIPLSPKAFDVLCLLLERRPNVVPKATLLDSIWPDTHVVDANLNVLVSEIRKALDDTPRLERYIATVHGRGFAFCGEAVALEDPPAAADAQGSGRRFWLAGKERTFVLREGENVIGRHPTCQVWLDDDGISRRHAKIHIDGAAKRAALEDLQSTNGTFVQSSRVNAPVKLADGDLIEIGSVALRFRAWVEEKPRRTQRIPRKAND